MITENHNKSYPPNSPEPLQSTDILKSFSDWDGSLVPIEFEQIPFEPKRIFYVTGVPINEIRGGHAHYKTLQYAVCMQGKIIVNLDYGMRKKQSVTLYKNEAVLINKMVWDEQQFCSGNDVLLVFCNTNYDKADYIESKSLFYSLVEPKK